MKHLFQTLCLVLVLCSAVNAQNCKVLLPALAGSYEGICKNDKANGNGKAIGTDTYEGAFKNGYPEGHGKYTWKNSDWYEGNFKSGMRNGEGAIHYPSTGKPDSTLTGFWAKDMYIGLYEAPYKIVSKSYLVSSVVVSPDAKQEPPQIMISLSSATGGINTDINKPELKSMVVKNGSFLTRTDVTTMNKKNIYYLINVIYPFSASFYIGDEEVVIDFNNTGSWTVNIVLRQ